MLTPIQSEDRAQVRRLHSELMHSNNFDAIRLALAVLVVFSHSWPLVFGNSLREPLDRFSGGHLTLGSVAVFGFFIISGFLITASWQRSRGLKQYLAKRILRIYPGYIACGVVSFGLVAPLAGVEPSQIFTPMRIVHIGYAVAVLRSFEHYQAFSKAPFAHVINGSIWTVRYEFLCYLMLPLLAWIGLLRRRWRILLAWMAVMAWQAAIILSQRLQQPADSALFTFMMFAGYFLAGAVFFVYREQFALRPVGILISLAVLAASARSYLGFVLVSPIALGYLIFSLAFTSRINLRHFGKFGDFSYGTYLYAFPIQQLWVSALGAEKLTPISLFGLSLFPSIIAGVVSWYLIERPFMSLKARTIQPLPETVMEANVVREDSSDDLRVTTSEGS